MKGKRPNNGLKDARLNKRGSLGISKMVSFRNTNKRFSLSFNLKEYYEGENKVDGS